MAEFDPDKPARVYGNLNEQFFDWASDDAEHLPAVGANQEADRSTWSKYFERLALPTGFEPVF